MNLSKSTQKSTPRYKYFTINRFTLNARSLLGFLENAWETTIYRGKNFNISDIHMYNYHCIKNGFSEYESLQKLAMFLENSLNQNVVFRNYICFVNFNQKRQFLHLRITNRVLCETEFSVSTTETFVNEFFDSVVDNSEFMTIVKRDGFVDIKEICDITNQAVAKHPNTKGRFCYVNIRGKFILFRVPAIVSAIHETEEIEEETIPVEETKDEYVDDYDDDYDEYDDVLSVIPNTSTVSIATGRIAPPLPPFINNSIVYDTRYPYHTYNSVHWNEHYPKSSYSYYNLKQIPV